jgi:hypothetical protein
MGFWDVITKPIGGITGGLTSAVGGLVGGTIGGIVKPLASGLGLTNDFQADTGGVQYNQELARALQQYNQQFATQQKAAQGLDAMSRQFLAQQPTEVQNPYAGMMAQAIDRGAKSQTAALAGQRGLNPALAQRLALQNANMMAQEGAGNVANQGAMWAAQQQNLMNQQRQANNENFLRAQQLALGSQESLGKQALSQRALTAEMLGNANRINSGVASGNQTAMSNLIGGILSGGSSVMAAAAGGGKFNGGRIDAPEVVEGDHPKNDIVPTMLSGGEIVIPKTKAQNKKDAKAFVDSLMEKEKSQDVGYGSVLEARRKLKELNEILGA